MGGLVGEPQSRDGRRRAVHHGTHLVGRAVGRFALHYFEEMRIAMRREPWSRGPVDRGEVQLITATMTDDLPSAKTAERIRAGGCGGRNQDSVAKLACT